MDHRIIDSRLRSRWVFGENHAHDFSAQARMSQEGSKIREATEEHLVEAGYFRDGVIRGWRC